MGERVTVTVAELQEGEVIGHEALWWIAIEDVHASLDGFVVPVQLADGTISEKRWGPEMHDHQLPIYQGGDAYAR